ncbi:uncharacterized protein LOC110187321 [Drosophila serrata]|uniref:uncharacterized protein LOC110187321 n=1 Tax=Drosophila serrata TaxID=7274 RepID=UPI000A1D3783|nr:uncharacterized protein LOC110187321 [Drosophila serrata]
MKYNCGKFGSGAQEQCKEEQGTCQVQDLAPNQPDQQTFNFYILTQQSWKVKYLYYLKANPRNGDVDVDEDADPDADAKYTSRTSLEQYVRIMSCAPGNVV